MKRLLLILLPLFILGCGSDDNYVADFFYSPTTYWKLSAKLNDPGDGSGTFQPVISERVLTIEVYRVVTNGSMCTPDGPVGPDEFADYDSNTPEFFVMNCDSTDVPRHFSYFFLDDSNELILDLGCDEPCWLRYERQ